MDEISLLDALNLSISRTKTYIDNNFSKNDHTHNYADKDHGTHLTLGTTSTTAYRGDLGAVAYTHSQAAHAPVDAQKNSDITKEEIEAKLVGDITSHVHNQYLTEHQSLSGYATETYVLNKIAEAKLEGEAVDLSGLATKDDLNNYAQLTDLHSHSNKSVLDGITSDKITEWNNKSTFSGSYNDLSDKPTIPSAYSHPTHTSYNSGLYKVTVNDLGHVTNAVAVEKSDITSLGIPGSDTTYNTGTSTYSGLTKLYTEVGYNTDGTMTQAALTAVLDEIGNGSQGSSLELGETSDTAYRGDLGAIAYAHSQESHAPSNAQKNSDITKEEIENKLTGTVTSHNHDGVYTKMEIISQADYNDLEEKDSNVFYVIID